MCAPASIFTTASNSWPFAHATLVITQLSAMVGATLPVTRTRSCPWMRLKGKRDAGRLIAGQQIYSPLGDPPYKQHLASEQVPVITFLFPTVCLALGASPDSYLSNRIIVVDIEMSKIFSANRAARVWPPGRSSNGLPHPPKIRRTAYRKRDGVAFIPELPG
ncbi:hypothetical protein HD806DRAFT_496106 [Xylariaceae sp. AK1471]|nr:hypothetical protein HD806DRAFT_496106 [Xylariaceae sp. AK1471]